MKDITEGTGNVYADLGNPYADAMLVKAQLATAIADSIAARKLTQQQAAKVLGLTQPKLSNLLNGRFRGISEAKMMDCLVRLGRDVRIVVGQERSRHEERGQIEVSLADLEDLTDSIRKLTDVVASLSRESVNAESDAFSPPKRKALA